MYVSLDSEWGAGKSRSQQGTVALYAAKRPTIYSGEEYSVSGCIEFSINTEDKALLRNTVLYHQGTTTMHFCLTTPYTLNIS